MGSQTLRDNYEAFGDGALMNEIRSHLRRDTREIMSLSNMCVDDEETAICKPGNRLPPSIKSADTFILNFPISDL
jgi:hypothetical protein